MQARVIVMFFVNDGGVQPFEFMGTATVTVTVVVVLVMVDGVTVTVPPLIKPAERMLWASVVALAAVAPGTIKRRQPAYAAMAEPLTT